MTTYTEGYNLVKVTFNGAVTNGPISIPGLKVGDKMVWLDHAAINGGPFETEVTVNDELQQVTGSNISASSYAALFVRNL